MQGSAEQVHIFRKSKKQHGVGSNSPSGEEEALTLPILYWDSIPCIRPGRRLNSQGVQGMIGEFSITEARRGAMAGWKSLSFATTQLLWIISSGKPFKSIYSFIFCLEEGQQDNRREDSISRLS